MPQPRVLRAARPRRPARLFRRLTGGSGWDFLYAVLLSVWPFS